MPNSQPSHGDWVAQPRPEVIAEGDAVPLTHTQLEAMPDRKVTITVTGRAPLPFAAIPIPAVLAVSIMGLTVLAATINALLAVLDGHPRRSEIIAVLLIGLVLWCALFAALVVVRKRPDWRSRPGIDTGEPRYSMAGLSRTTANATRTDCFVDDAEELDHQAEHGRSRR